MKRLPLLLLICTVFLMSSMATYAQHSFTIIPLGVYGGNDEGNLSSYLIAPAGDSSYVALDAGTLTDGLRAARRRRVFKMSAASFQRRHIKGYLISHPHLDHVAGLIINSPEDSHKNIYGLSFTIKALRTKYFSWLSWANFADQGEQPALKKYHYVKLQDAQEIQLDRTKMQVTPYELSHAVPGKSTAFLIRHDKDYFLYLGDSGDDDIEQSHQLARLWQAVAPLVKSRQLKGIAIECSFPDEQPNKHLFGHLKPTLLMKNLTLLDSLAGGTAQQPALSNFPVIITHIKPIGDNEQTIQKALRKQNDLGVQLIFPKRGKKIML